MTYVYCSRLYIFSSASKRLIYQSSLASFISILTITSLQNNLKISDLKIYFENYVLCTSDDCVGNEFYCISQHSIINRPSVAGASL